MALIVKYKFQNVDANGNSVTLLPQFPSGVSYTKTDVVEGNITTRVIETDDLSKVTYIRFGCNENTYVAGAWEYLTEILDINISYVNTFYRMFRGCKLLNKINVSNWDTSKVTSMNNMFQSCFQLTQLDVSNWDTVNVTNMGAMFYDCLQLTQLDVSNWDTSKVQYMNNMFYDCPQLTQLDVSNWDTSKVQYMNNMFQSCSQLTRLDVSNWDTSNVINMNNMFHTCSQLAQLDVSNFDTSKVINMSFMFNSCKLLTSLDVSNFDTSKVTNMAYMFNSCKLLTSLDVSNFDTSNVTSMECMFKDCALITLDVSNFDTSNVTSMASMFYNCSSLTQLDVSNFDISNNTRTNNIFTNCKVKDVGLIYCLKETIDKLANCITSPCNFYATNKTYTSPNPLVKYVMYREDKKPLLYYNDETQTWEKPILRQWDSIEKHADGKYYYHKRSGEVVLDGSEDWMEPIDFTNCIRMRYSFNKLPTTDNVVVLNDKFNLKNEELAKTDVEGIWNNQWQHLNITILKSKLSTQDLAGFKQWLQANPTTVVYQLAEEKVYECTDLDLITYADETNLMVKSGIIVPKATLKIHQDIANITTILQEKVSVLENDTNTINSEINTINSNTNTINSEINTINSNINTINSNINTINSNINTMNSNINTMNSNINTMSTEIDNINTDLIGVSESIEGSWISVDSKDGYLKDIEILGNTIQNQNNLADIRSVGDKLENQELYEIDVVSCGKNLININDIVVNQGVSTNTGIFGEDSSRSRTPYIKFNPNTNYVTTNVDVLIFYDENKQFISSNRYSIGVSPANCKYIVARMLNTTTDWQLEEGTVKTPYEPYQEDKLTILSPTPLEKVGDVADRIVCKDGVWGVEKNIETATFDGSETYLQHSFTLENCQRFRTNNGIYGTSNYAICNTFITIEDSGLDIEGIRITKTGNIDFVISKNKVASNDVSDFKIWLSKNPTLVKYQTTQPQFIPLPYDQQIKLRTFVGQTNIHFETEIEGTIKAQVPKSIGATVNSHTEQIDNLGKELDRVKKLEESVASEVITESDFTTVEETSNGYFEGVKLEGRTLVNLCKNGTGKTINSSNTNYDLSFIDLSIGKTYTLIINQSLFSGEGVRIGFLSADRKNWIKTDFYIDYTRDNEIIQTFTFTNSTISELRIQAKGTNSVVNATSDHIINYVILLEGDHTQNPPKYFEGLKSVGDGVDEISVLSVKGDGNLFNVNDVVSDYSDYYKCDEYIKYENGGQRTYLKRDFEPNTQYSFTFKASNSKASSILFSCRYTDGTYKTFEIINSESNKIHTSSFTSSEGKSIKELCSFYSDSEIITLYLDGTCINKGTTPIPYTPYKQDKKRILYYNEETQTWEKPILRQWDSIEKRGDKYYYIKRSGEVVLNGSMGWTGFTERENTVRVVLSNAKDSGVENFITDKYIVKEVYSVDVKGVQGSTTNGNIFLSVNKNILSEVSIQGVKNYLNSNPFTVLYKLSTEKIYECTDIDIITYADETNLLVKSGVLNPKVTLKVHQNITNIITILQNKVSVLENVFIQGLKQVLAGDMQSLAYTLYPEDFENIEQSIDETSLGEQQDDPTDK